MRALPLALHEGVAPGGGVAYLNCIPVVKQLSVAETPVGSMEGHYEFRSENGRFRVARKTIRDSYPDRELDIGGIIKRSSNVGAAKIAMMLGAEALHDALAHYGFGQKTDHSGKD